MKTSSSDSFRDSGPAKPTPRRWSSRIGRFASEHLIALAFGLCVCGVLGFGFLALHLVGRSQAGDARVLHTAVAIGKLEAFHLALVETESAGRGFLISGAPLLKSRYASMLAGIDEQLREFKAFTSDNPDQQKLIPGLEQSIASRFAYMDALIGVRVTRGVEAAVQATTVGTGVREMQSIRDHIGRMKVIENRLLEDRRAAQKRNDARLETALAMLIAFGVAIMGVMFWNMRRLWLARLRAEAAALEQAHHDTLTGLPNRRLLQDRLRVALARANRDGDVLAVLCLDLDGFKAVNDTYGHPAGDELLRRVGERLGGLMRAEDTAARIGGDEFVVVLSSISGALYSELVAGRIVQSLSAPYTIQGHSVAISTSIGIAVSPTHGSDAAALLKAADEALYSAKKLGKARFSTARAALDPPLELAAEVH
jgi:diguanylate cyclase (GGDEF)-like protein